jgi:hypothetical protein
LQKTLEFMHKLFIFVQKRNYLQRLTDLERGKIRVFTSTQAREFGENAWHFSEDTEPEVNKGV